MNLLAQLSLTDQHTTIETAVVAGIVLADRIWGHARRRPQDAAIRGVAKDVGALKTDMAIVKKDVEGIADDVSGMKARELDRLEAKARSK